MVNVILCGTPVSLKEDLVRTFYQEKRELVKKIHTMHKQRIIPDVLQDCMDQRNITPSSVHGLQKTDFIEFQSWVIIQQCKLEAEYSTSRTGVFLSESSVIDSLVQVDDYVGKDAADELVSRLDVRSSIEKYQSSLVILLLPQPCTYLNEHHGKKCEKLAVLYRSYFQFLNIAYLELRNTNMKSREDAIKKALKLGEFPLETAKLQKQEKEVASHTSNFAFYKPAPKDGNSIHIPTIQISGEMSEQNWTPFPLGETNRFIERHGSKNLAAMSFHINVKANVVESTLGSGITINGSHYSFLGCSSSGLKTRKCYLWKGTAEEAKAKLVENGAFEKISSLSKRMARIGLLFSSVRLTHQVPANIINTNDVERNGKCFTDGCGSIGTDLARKVYEELEGGVIYSRTQGYLPSVYQVRIQGCKGMLALDPTLDTNSIMVRPSMAKFETTVHPRIGVCRHSKAHTFGHLNKQFIMLLSGLGVPDSVYLEKQKEYFDNVLEMGKDKEKTIRILQWQNKFDEAQMISKSDFDSNNQQIADCIKHVQRKLMSKPKKPGTSKSKKPGMFKSEELGMSKSEKLSILIPESRTIYGVCDQTQTLQYGECFLRLTLGNEGRPKTIRGKVVVCKNPCYLLGDVRVLTAVDVSDRPGVQDLNHLVDCIVFPVVGHRPHPDEIAGSDLDGDEFFVTWDESLIPPSTRPPFDYAASTVVLIEKDMIRYFAKQNEVQKLTCKADKFFNKWANLKGVVSDECQELGKLFSRVIDSNKSGEPIAIPKHLKPRLDATSHDHQEHVWQKMQKKGKWQNKFWENVVKQEEVSLSETSVSQATVEEIIGQEFSNITEYEKFRFALKHTRDVEEVLDLYGENINFAMFTREEKCEALSSGVPKDLLENALNKSALLSQEDLAFFNMQTFRHPWSYYFRVEHEQFDWSLLLRALTENDQTFIAFELQDGITVVLQFLTKWTVGIEQAVAAGTISVFFYSRRFGYRRKYVLGGNYSLDLTADILRLYRNQDTHQTFVFFNDSDCKITDTPKQQATLCNETVNAISVDLTFFDRSIRTNRTKPHPGIRKVPFQDIEVFAHSNSDSVAYFDTYDANDVLPVPEIEDVETEVEDDAIVDVESMMVCYGSYHIDTEEELIQKLEASAVNAKPLAFKMILQAWRETGRELSKGTESCFIHLLHKLALEVPPLSLSETVKDILETMVQSTEYKVPEVMCGILGLLSRLGMEDTSGSLCEKYEKEIKVQMKEFLKIISTWEMWWMLDKDIAKLFLSKLVICDDAIPPSDVSEESIREALDHQLMSYISHFGTLQLLDLLNEAECVRQKMNQSKADSSICNLKILKRKDGNEETVTFCRSTALQHNPKISNGQYVAITRQLDYSRTQSFRAYCCVAQVMSIKFVNVVVKVPGDLPNVLKENIDPSCEKSFLWRINLLTNVTTHTRVVDALSRLKLSEGQESIESLSPSSDLLQMLIQPGGHPETSPLSGPSSFSLHNNESGLSVENTYDFSVSLNKQQENAVVSAVKQRVSLIQGPPGTGKTTVACEIIRTIHSMSEDSKILVVAETNVAVDNIVKRLKEDLESEILRVGSEGGIYRDVFDVTLEGQLRMLEERESKKTTYKDEQGLVRMKKKHVQNLVRKTRIVLTTCAGAGDPDLKSSTFQFVLIDEATQTRETTLLCSLAHGAQHLIMIGDPRQLGPVVAREDNSRYAKLPDLESLSTTLFHRLYTVLSKECIFLDTQHRMHPALMKFPSDQFYDGRLRSAIEDSTRPEIIFPWADPRRPLCFINVNSVEQRLGTSFCNDAEVHVVQNVLEMIFNVPEEYSQFRVDSTEIGILSLYQAQVKEIRNAITFPVQVSSIDGFQGKEKEVIVVSTVRANDRGNLRFVEDRNRTNVLLTRAKRGLIVIGNEKTLMTLEVWSKWLNDAPKLAAESVQQRLQSSQDKRNKGNGYQGGRGFRGNRRDQGQRRSWSGRGRNSDHYRSDQTSQTQATGSNSAEWSNYKGRRNQRGWESRRGNQEFFGSGRSENSGQYRSRGEERSQRRAPDGAMSIDSDERSDHRRREQGQRDQSGFGMRRGGNSTERPSDFRC